MVVNTWAFNRKTILVPKMDKDVVLLIAGRPNPDGQLSTFW